MNERNKKYYDLLGIKADASDQEVYDAYREAYDTCGFTAKLATGSPNLATGKIKEINDAYDKIMASRKYIKINQDKTTNFDAVITTEQEQSKETPADDKTKICPFCAETIKLKANKCRYCGEWLEKVEPFLSKDVSNGKSTTSPELAPQQSTVGITEYTSPRQSPEQNIVTLSHKTILSMPNVLFLLYLLIASPILYSKEKSFAPFVIAYIIGYSIIPIIFVVAHNLKKDIKWITIVSSIISIFWIILTVFGTLGSLGFRLY